MTKLSWQDPSWRLTAPDPTFACCPPVVGNGLMGVRLGAFVLGTDPGAPAWSGVGQTPMLFTMPRFDPASPLPMYARFMRDGTQVALPAWHMLDLRVDGVRFQPGQGLFRGESSLDLRTGEASLDGTWMTRPWTEPGPSVTVRIAIRLLLPRTVNHGGFFELSVEGADCLIEASVGWQARHLPEYGLTWTREGRRLLGDGRTPIKSRPLRLGAQLDVTAGTVEENHGQQGDPGWTVVGADGRLGLSLCATVHGGMEPGDPDAARRADLNALAAGRADGSLRRANEDSWRSIWSRAFDVTTLPVEDRQTILAQQYYLLASADASPWPTGPQGVAGNNWGGQQMWDNDLWTFRALLPLWPEFAESLVAARLRMLPEARKIAARDGLRGAILTVADEDGLDRVNELYRQEIHFSVWPAFGVWDLWRVTGDREKLRLYWPLLRDTADFLLSRGTADADDSWHLRGVIPPDEYVCEHGAGACDDSVTTNLLARAVLRAGHEAASLLDEPADPAWRTMAENLYILGPDENGIIPEFAGYAGQTIKQGDAILAFYPFDVELPPDLVRRNLLYYRERSDPFGPLMSAQIDACVLMRQGEREEGWRVMMQRYRRHLRGAFLIPTEGPHNNVVGFTTGCGGLLQALIYGMSDYRQPGDDAQAIPRLGCEG